MNHSWRNVSGLYVDDVIIYNKTQENIQYLKAILQTGGTCGVNLNLEERVFFLFLELMLRSIVCTFGELQFPKQIMDTLHI
jgi:hypothetical protein